VTLRVIFAKLNSVKRVRARSILLLLGFILYAASSPSVLIHGFAHGASLSPSTDQAVGGSKDGGFFGKTAPFRTIDSKELKDMLNDDKQKFLLVDTRTEFEFRQNHIPGAISIAPHRFRELTTLLPGDKDFPIVFYCRGTG
jgi:hypothetical protein